MVDKKPVSIGWQTAFMFIPYVWIFAFYRIEKLRLGLILVLIAAGASIGIQMVFPFPYGFAISLGISIALPVRFIRKWSREWNAKIGGVTG